MCHKNRGPRCSDCHKPAPRHRCRCPAKYTSAQTATSQHDDPPPYVAMIEPQPPTSTLLPTSLQPRCKGNGYGRCGHQRRPCQGPIRLLVSLVIRKVQEKKEREGLAPNLSNEWEDEQQDRGVVEDGDEGDEKQMEVKEKEKYEDVKLLTKSLGRMSS